jgi:hypothetical protein
VGCTFSPDEVRKHNKIPSLFFTNSLHNIPLSALHQTSVFYNALYWYGGNEPKKEDLD